MNNNSPELEPTLPEDKETSTESDNSNSDWLAERKSEIRSVLENKSRELSKRAQQHFSRKLISYESALNSASDSLEADNEKQPATVTREIAKHVRNTADYFENNEPEEIVEATAEKVKKTPLIALGAALAAGFVVGRLLASAKDEPATSSSNA